MVVCRLRLGVEPPGEDDPRDLMLEQQRLKQLSDARREETIYRLLAPDPGVEIPGAGGGIEARPLHVHTLEPPR